MKKSIIKLIVVILIISSKNILAIDNQTAQSVVKIFVTANSMDYYRPWQSHGISGKTGSGVVIEGGYILTNAHVVLDQTFVQVKKLNSSKKYTAKVEAIGYDCDLALLKIEDKEFFQDIKEIPLGKMVHLQDDVAVIGYPKGGEKISITKGVVSRIEVSDYVQSGRRLLSIQIDAAINSGNSGGPVIKDNKIVGIAMQALNNSQNIGYMIPVLIIQHFLDDLKDRKYNGFPSIGIEFMNTENEALRKYYEIDKEEGGVLITRVEPYSSAEGFLKKGDIILSISGILISQDGRVKYRNNEKLFLSYLISKKHVGENIRIEIVREGIKQEITIRLKSFYSVVPYPYHIKKPTYYIFGGLVFTTLTTNLIQSWGEWWKNAPINFNYYLIGSGRLNKEKRKEVVVLLNVLSDDVNIGYHRVRNVVIEKVNGKTFKTFKEFVKIINKIKKQEDFIIFEIEGNQKIILDNEDIDKKTKDIIKRNHIPTQSSSNIRL